MKTHFSHDVSIDTVEKREAVPGSITGHLAYQHSVLVTAPLGSATADLVREAIAELSQTYTVVRTPSPLPSPDQLRDRTAPVLFVAEKAEAITKADLERLTPFADGGGLFLIASEHDSTSRALLSSLKSLSTSNAQSDDTPGFVHIRIDPLPFAEIQLLVNQCTGEHLPDILSREAIAELSYGRYGWIRDLTTLWSLGHLTARPFAAIPASPLPPARLPEIARVVEMLRDLDSQAMCTAIILSEIEPLSLTSAANVFDRQHVRELVAKSILTSHGSNDRYTVAPFIGAALRELCPSDELSTASMHAAERLLLFEHIGIQLRGRDATFCARNTDVARLLTTAEKSHLVTPYKELLERTFAEKVQFAAPENYRSVMLQIAQIEHQISPLDQTRMHIRQGHSSELDESLATLHASSCPNTAIGARFMHAHAHARYGNDLASPPAAHEDQPSHEHHEFRLWKSWNNPDIENPVPDLHDSLAEHPERIVRDAHQALIDLDLVWHGQNPPSGSWLRNTSRQPLFARTLHSGIAEIAATVLIAQALIAYLAGEFSLRVKELRIAAGFFPASAYHQSWITLLEHADHAAKRSDLVACARELHGLTLAIPELVGLRLKKYLEVLSRAVSAVAADSSDHLYNHLATTLPVGRQHLYYAGRFDVLLRTRSMHAETDNVLPIIRLARKHLEAKAEMNPHALSRVADTFHQYGHVSLAFNALHDARQVYTSRRASSKVAECNTKLEAIKETARRIAPWHTNISLRLPEVLKLSHRELAAAKLAAQGLSNKAIAEALGIKIRTIESHIAQARAKLGAKSRKDLSQLLPHEH